MCYLFSVVSMKIKEDKWEYIYLERHRCVLFRQDVFFA